jgi:LPS sulfotransferase NodH
MNNDGKKSMRENIIERVSETHDLTSTPTSHRYVICSSPRSGSNYLCSLLKAMNAGNPMEYLHPNYSSAMLQRINKKSIDFQGLMRELEDKRTGPQGHFGIKIQFWQLEQTFKKNPRASLSYLKAQDSIIYLHRKNKVEQALSLYFAQQTNAYQASDKVEKAELKFNPAAIARCMHLVIKDDFAWEVYLKKSGLDYLSVCYEDLIKSRDKQLNLIAKKLNLTKPKKVDESALTQKQDHPQYEEFLKQFKQYLGC